LERAKIPIVADNDKEAFETALRSCGYLKEGEGRIIRIKDTLHLDEMYVSRPVMDLIRSSSGIESLKGDVNMFNEDNEFNPF